MAHAPAFQSRDDQWVDPPTSAQMAAPMAAAHGSQNMVFQWVDNPRRPVPQPHPYAPVPPVPSPYGIHGQPPPVPPWAGGAAQPHLDYQGGGGAWPGAYDPYGGHGGDPYYDRGDHGMRGRPQQDRKGQHSPFAAQQDGQSRRAPRRSPNEKAEGPKGRGKQAGPPNQMGGKGAGGAGVGGGGLRQGDQAELQLAAVVESLGQDGVREVLVSALESIYKDRIKPMGNYVKGRLKERGAAEAIVKHFVELYQQYFDLFTVIDPKLPDEVSMYFVKEPSWFNGWVDIDSANDPYEEKMWGDFEDFLKNEHTFAGGRYGMARDLSKRELPFMSELSLGEICHIVQLAIQHRKLIVYHRKMLKPIQTIMCQQPTPGNAAGSDEIKDMDHLCLVLFRMLIRHPQGIQLSRVKQTIKHEFGCTISEIAFQCTKLSELFNREILAETFKLETEDGGKSMCIRMGSPGAASSSEHAQKIFAEATAIESKHGMHASY